MKVAAIYLATAVSDVAAASCSGTDDPVISGPVCYHGKGGALGLTETVDVKINDFSSGAGHIEVVGAGIEGFTCSNKDFTKSGQEIATDLTDCQPSGISIPAIKYCSDQDSIKVTVRADAVPLPVSATLTKVDCASETAVASCSGTADPDVSEPVCYHGKGGALGLTENVDVKIDDLAAGAGHIEVSGSGIEDFTCTSKPFTKADQEITTDLSDCQPDAISITHVKYCSDQDTIKVTVKANAVPIPVTATMQKVDCASREAVASCSGSDDPVVSEPMCYHGKGGALGLTETVDVKIGDFAAGAGHIDVAGDGIEAFTCTNKEFSKGGQAITTDLTDCQPDGIAITAIKYCSDQDTIRVTVKDTTVPLPISATMQRVACASTEVV
jgi:ribosomal protein L24E